MPPSPRRPLGRIAAWLLFAALFYASGEAFTRLALAGWSGPQSDWLWASAFPVLLALFLSGFASLGCPGGACPRAGAEGGPGLDKAPGATQCFPVGPERPPRGPGAG
jgi:hypothetical protein